MKKIYSLLIIALITISCSSDDNNIASSGESEACVKIKAGVDQAFSDYTNSSQSNTVTNCKRYLDALKDQKTVCGDPDGEIQKKIDGLKGCASDNT